MVYPFIVEGKTRKPHVQKRMVRLGGIWMTAYPSATQFIVSVNDQCKLGLVYGSDTHSLEQSFGHRTETAILGRDATHLVLDCIITGGR